MSKQGSTHTSNNTIHKRPSTFSSNAFSNGGKKSTTDRRTVNYVALLMKWPGRKPISIPRVAGTVVDKH